jgi:pimeloyl-ACP methyl ester carboxylesterase
MTWLWILLLAVGPLAGVVAVSYLVEGLRRIPTPPDALGWAPDVPIRYLDIGGVTVRSVTVGSGPDLVLLHTLRTQLDLFQKVIPALARGFTVHAFDYPGHGWSDIPPAQYAPEDFYAWVARYLDAADVRDAVVAGVSIGGTIALALAARRHRRIAAVVAVNPYDDWPAGRLSRSSLAARLVLSLSDVPVVGATFMRLRNRFVSDRIFAGGVAAPDALPRDLAAEFYRVGARRGHYQAFLSLLANERLWPMARREYGSIAVPVLLAYGAKDWAPEEERERTRSLIPRVESRIIPNAGHFLPLDRPEEFQGLILGFTRT